MIAQSPSYLVHVAGPVLHASAPDASLVVLRQRCAWCGALLIHDSVPAGKGFQFTFDAQSQVAVQNGCAWVVPPSGCTGLDPQSCLNLDPYVTR